jgi:hypothetical protein
MVNCIDRLSGRWRTGVLKGIIRMHPSAPLPFGCQGEAEMVGSVVHMSMAAQRLTIHCHHASCALIVETTNDVYPSHFVMHQPHQPQLYVAVQQ